MSALQKTKSSSIKIDKRFPTDPVYDATGESVAKYHQFGRYFDGAGNHIPALDVPASIAAGEAKRRRLLARAGEQKTDDDIPVDEDRVEKLLHLPDDRLIEAAKAVKAKLEEEGSPVNITIPANLTDGDRLDLAQFIADHSS